MRSLTKLIILGMALLALCAPGIAAGVRIGMADCLPVPHAEAHGLPANLPSPCDLQGGKRVLPSQPQPLRAALVEVPRATVAQWARGLADEPMRRALVPATELPPPRRG